MTLDQIQPGDMIFAASDIYNDGSVPGLAEGELIAAAGTRGVLVNTGHLEEQPNVQLFLVRFEDEEMNLGPAVGCWAEELRTTSA